MHTKGTRREATSLGEMRRKVMNHGEIHRKARILAGRRRKAMARPR